MLHSYLQYRCIQHNVTELSTKQPMYAQHNITQLFTIRKCNNICNTAIYNTNVYNIMSTQLLTIQMCTT